LTQGNNRSFFHAPSGCAMAEVAAPLRAAGADSGAVNTLSSSCSTGAEAPLAAWKAEFERRRRVDRQQRRLERGASEVQQILLEVQQERHATTDHSFCSKSTASAPGTPPASHRCSHSPNFSSGGHQLPKQERQVSSLQQILADVQRERQAASAAAAAAVTSAKPEAAATKTKAARIEPKPQSKAASKAAAKPSSNLATVTIPKAMPKSAARPADSTRSSAHSPQRRQLNFEGAVGSKPQALKPREASATKQAQSGEKAALPASLPAALQRLQQQQQQQPHLPRQQGTSQPRKPRAAKLRRSQSPRPRSTSPKRRLEVGCVRQAFENIMAQAWAADLRRYGADDCSSGKQQVQAFPAGGWDNRTTCPRLFSGRPGRPQPQERPAERKGLARSSSAPQIIRARGSEAKPEGKPVVQAPSCTTSSEQCALSETAKAPDAALSNGSGGGANDMEAKGVTAEPVTIEAVTDAGKARVSGTVLDAASAVDTPEALCTSGNALAT